MTDGCGRKIGPYDCCTIVTGDARELAPAIPDETVDLIFTDPVYDRIEDYRWLAETAAGILKKGRSCLCFQWGSYLRETLATMTALDYQAICVLHYSNRVVDARNKVGINKWTPLLWLSKGFVASPRLLDLISCKAFDDSYGDGRSRHEWSKPPEFIAYYMQGLESDIVFDPFTGSGTVPAVCKMLGRHYLAFEIDPDVAERARERVRNTQPPLFVVQPEQAEMGL